MEVILDELQKHNVDMNMKTSSYYINDWLQQHKTLYKEFTEHVKFDEISVVFAETRVNNFWSRYGIFDAGLLDESPRGRYT